MRERTRVLHAKAERSGVVQDILRGRVTRTAYQLFMRNLLPVYACLESSLEKRRDRPAIAAIAWPQLYRSAALRSDLESLCGPDWERSIPLMEATPRYTDRISRAAEGDAAGLIAHAYTRYLGDLNGGRVLGRVLGQSLALQPSELSFYRFADIVDPRLAASSYRAALRRAGLELDTFEPVLAEAEHAFSLNIEVSEEVQARAADHTA